MVTIGSINKKLGFDFTNPESAKNLDCWDFECDDPEKSPFYNLDEEDFDFLDKYYGL